MKRFFEKREKRAPMTNRLRAMTTVGLGLLISAAPLSCGTSDGPSDTGDPTISRAGELGSETWQGGSKVIKLAAGADHTCALFDGGGVKCWGYNDRRQLGQSTDVDATEAPESLAQMVATLGAGVTSISAGDQHTCALFEEGWVKCWGVNLNNELGRKRDDGNEAAISDAVVEDLGAGVVDIKSAERRTCALYDGGAIRCWPLAKDQGDESAFEDPIDGYDGGAGNLLGMAAAPAGYEIAPGGGCYWSAEGRTQCWGFAFPQAAVVLRDMGRFEAGVTDVAMGTPTANGNHICAIRGEDILCMGVNIQGELGNGKDERELAPVEVIGLRGKPVDITAGVHFNCAVMDDGAVYCWGRNDDGQLGDGTTNDASIPVKAETSAPAVAIEAGSTHVCAILETGGVECWGANHDLQAGVEGGDDNITTPTAPTGLMEF